MQAYPPHQRSCGSFAPLLGHNEHGEVEPREPKARPGCGFDSGQQLTVHLLGGEFLIGFCHRRRAP